MHMYTSIISLLQSDRIEVDCVQKACYLMRTVSENMNSCPRNSESHRTAAYGRALVSENLYHKIPRTYATLKRHRINQRRIFFFIISEPFEYSALMQYCLGSSLRDIMLSFFHPSVRHSVCVRPVNIWIKFIFFSFIFQISFDMLLHLFLCRCRTVIIWMLLLT